MKYVHAELGRTFVLKFDHDDDFFFEMKTFCLKEGVLSGSVQFIGAMHDGTVVIGPKNSDLPPIPQWKSIDSPHEVFGFGTIVSLKGVPHIHLHTVFSNETGAFVGCIRQSTTVFIVVEAIVSEFISDNIKREYDNKTGLNLLSLS